MKARLPGHWSFILCDKKCVSSSSVENWCSKVLTLLFQVKQSFFVLFFAANSVMPNRWLQVTSDHLMNPAMLDTTMVCRNGHKKSLLGKSLVILFFCYKIFTTFRIVWYKHTKIKWKTFFISELISQNFHCMQFRSWAILNRKKITFPGFFHKFVFCYKNYFWFFYV